MSDLETISSSVPPEILKLLDEEAEAQYRTRSAHIRAILEEHFKPKSRMPDYTGPAYPPLPYVSGKGEPYIGGPKPPYTVVWSEPTNTTNTSTPEDDEEEGVA